MIIKTGALAASHELIYQLGESTNQVAEIWAIGGALTTIREDVLAKGAEIHIFSDSEFSIKCLRGIYTSKIHHNIIKHVLNLIDSFPRNTVIFHHVAGHAGIPGNEIADALANMGAKLSESSPSTLDLPTIAKTYGFNHQLFRDDRLDEIT